MNIPTLLFVVLSQFTFSLRVPPAEVRNLVDGKWKLPSNLSPWRMERLLNRFAKAHFGKSFRYLGDDEDFFHGHLLIEIKKQGEVETYDLRAILYHTQERAHRAHWKKTLDAKYDYIDPRGRNWLQFLTDDAGTDGAKIENAIDYATPSKTKFYDSFFKTGEPDDEANHYTIHDSNLDRTKLGVEGRLGSMQVEFWREDCETLYPVDLAYKRGPIKVKLGDNERCLHIATYNGFSPIKE